MARLKKRLSTVNAKEVSALLVSAEREAVLRSMVAPMTAAEVMLITWLAAMGMDDHDAAILQDVFVQTVKDALALPPSAMQLLPKTKDLLEVWPRDSDVCVCFCLVLLGGCVPGLVALC